MSDYDGMDYEELLGECEWMSDFLSLMAERITKNPDVHNLVDYVRKIEDENAKLRELVIDLYNCDDEVCLECEHRIDGTIFYCDLGIGWKMRRIRELGIEVHHAD